MSLSSDSDAPLLAKRDVLKEQNALEPAVVKKDDSDSSDDDVPIIQKKPMKKTSKCLCLVFKPDTPPSLDIYGLKSHNLPINPPPFSQHHTQLPKTKQRRRSRKQQPRSQPPRRRHWLNLLLKRRSLPKNYSQPRRRLLQLPQRQLE